MLRGSRTNTGDIDRTQPGGRIAFDRTVRASTRLKGHDKQDYAENDSSDASPDNPLGQFILAEKFRNWGDPALLVTVWHDYCEFANYDSGDSQQQ